MTTSKKKRPTVAAILNFVFPGLGLLYLGWARAALVNFLVVNGILLVCVVFGDAQLIDHVHYVFLGLAALSAGYAHGVAASTMRPKNGVSQGPHEGVMV